MPKYNTIDSIWSRIDVRDEEECWNWLGGKSPRGYGRIWFKGREYPAHRLIYILTYGNIEDIELVLHDCMNESCCNPKHLKLGDNKVNSQYPDKAKLNVKQVEEVRHLYRIKQYDQYELAYLYDVDQSTISDICRLISW